MIHLSPTQLENIVDGMLLRQKVGDDEDLILFIEACLRHFSEEQYAEIQKALQLH